VCAIKKLFDGAPQEVRTALQIQADYGFAWKGGLLRGMIR